MSSHKRKFMIGKPKVGYWILFLLLSTNLSWAQQNYFNIPSGDITQPGKVFYQHQINVYSLNKMESKSQLVVGIGRNWEIGFNIVDLPLNFDGASKILGSNDDPSAMPLYPLAMFTLQKQFRLNETIGFNLGTQAGANLTGEAANVRFAHFTYALIEYHVPDKGHWTVGTYVSNEVYTGSPGNVIGWIAGFDFPISRHFWLMGDIVSGNNKKSLTTLGGVYNIGHRVQICAAGLFPFPNRSLQGGMVLELNLYGWNWDENH